MGHYLAGLQSLQQIRYEKLAVLPVYRSSGPRQEVIHYPIVRIAIAGEWGEPHPVAVLEQSISK
jgi:hypothetical protein